MLIPFPELFARFNVAPKGVLHLGANSGQEAETYHNLGIKTVIWVEALPEVYQKLETYIAQYPGQIALQACVSDVDGQTVQFHVASNDAQSSSMLTPTLHKIEHPTVKFNSIVNLTTVRVDSLLRNIQNSIGPDWFLNVDLQGAELLALRGMGELLHKFKYAYLEVNNKELYKGCPLVPEIDAFLEPFGFEPKLTRWTGSGWGDKFYSK